MFFFYVPYTHENLKLHSVHVNVLDDFYVFHFGNQLVDHFTPLETGNPSPCDNHLLDFFSNLPWKCKSTQLCEDTQHQSATPE